MPGLGDNTLLTASPPSLHCVSPPPIPPPAVVRPWQPAIRCLALNHLRQPSGLQHQITDLLPPPVLFYARNSPASPSGITPPGLN
jgi:hypothetical protein